MEIPKERLDTNQETAAVFGLGIVNRKNNQFQTAIKYFDKALEIAKQHGDTNQETEPLLGLGIV